MSSNLRARPIQGALTDNAGNIIRNSSLLIYSSDSSGQVASVDTDSSGKFKTVPLPSGMYSVYNYGILVVDMYHNADFNSYAVQFASTDNYPIENTKSFYDLSETNTVNDFISYIQVEDDRVNTDIYGSSFPLWENTDINNVSQNYSDMYSFFDMTSASRITMTRFDIEYNTPVTFETKALKYIRFAGVPGIKYSEDSKIVIPLDYRSIVANRPIAVWSDVNKIATVEVSGSSNSSTIEFLPSQPEFTSRIAVGDILKLEADDDIVWYGIVSKKGIDSTIAFTLNKWDTSRYTSEDLVSLDILKASHYNGLFPTILALKETVGERFSVVENTYAQNSDDELYQY